MNPTLIELVDRLGLEGKVAEMVKAEVDRMVGGSSPVPPAGGLTCPVCGRPLGNKAGLAMHMKAKHPEG